jgi:hypothetical protein
MPHRDSPQPGRESKFYEKEMRFQIPIEDIGLKSRVIKVSNGREWRWVNPRINDLGICTRIRKIGVQLPQCYDLRGPSQSRTSAIDL